MSEAKPPVKREPTAQRGPTGSHGPSGNHNKAGKRGTGSSAALPRAWQRMLSGRRLDLLDPSPLDIEIEDIAHGLARVARWNGQTVGAHAFSVAQHSLIVEQIAAARRPDWPPAHCLAALLHDAAEYVVGDLISPFKSAIGLDYKAFEQRLMQAIHVRFGLAGYLPAAIAGEIKSADRIAAFYEATRLAGFEVAEARQFFGTPDGISAALAADLSNLEPVSTAVAQRRFLDRFNELEAAVRDGKAQNG